jgi:hypothetical protein
MGDPPLLVLLRLYALHYLSANIGLANQIVAASFVADEHAMPQMNARMLPEHHSYVQSDEAVSARRGPISLRILTSVGEYKSQESRW